MGNNDESSGFVATPTASYDQIVATARATYHSGKTRDVKWRKAQLRQLYKMIDENQARIIEAVRKDLAKPKYEAVIGEVLFCLNQVVFCLERIDEWVKPDYPKKGIAELGAGLKVLHEPFGVCLLISPWNYPFNLMFQPFVNALAAGNTCVLKPSEIAPHSAMLMAELVPKYLDREAIFVVNGGVKETTALLERHFDHITYTGSTVVGKIIMAAAAKFLTPVILELGGKSPVVLDPKLTQIDVERAARRIANTKYFNMGQTCIAPDYVLCPSHLVQPFARAVKDHIAAFYGANPSASADLGRIVNKSHTRRVGTLLDQQKSAPGSVVVCGGNWDESKCWVDPTVVVGVRPDGPLMSQELFGPVLPILECNSAEQAVQMIRARDRPLALYIYTQDNKFAEQVHLAAISGDVVINDCIYHYGNDDSPFGGVGASGMGALHSKWGFMAYTHHKTVLAKPLDAFSEFVNDMTGRYPPYTEKAISTIEAVAKHKLPVEPTLLGSAIKWGAVVAAAGAAASFAAKRLGR